MAVNEVLLGAAGARQGKLIFQNGKLRMQAGTAPAWTDYVTIDSAGLITLPTATAAASGLKLGTVVLFDSGGGLQLADWSDGAGLKIGGSTVLGYEGTDTLFGVYQTAYNYAFKAGVNGQRSRVVHASGTKTTSSGTGTETVTGAIPAGCLLLGVSNFVQTILAGAGLTTWSAGTPGVGNTDRFATGKALAAGTTTTLADFKVEAAADYALGRIYPAATDLVFTAAAGVFSSGVIRYTIHYLALTAASS